MNKRLFEAERENLLTTPKSHYEAGMLDKIDSSLLGILKVYKIIRVAIELQKLFDNKNRI